MAAINLYKDILKVENGGTLIKITTTASVGILALTGFTDTVVGAPTKTFRYSTDGGITWSQWTALTTPNITGVVVPSIKSLLVFELNYYDPTAATSVGIAEVAANQANTNSVVVGGAFFKNSMFSEFFNLSDVDLLRWVMNVLQKTYQQGVVAKFVDRLNDQGKPTDYVEFWRSVVTFFGLYVRYANEYADYYNNPTLLEEYLRQRGLEISTEDDLFTRQLIGSRFNEQMLRRGTVRVFDAELNFVDQPEIVGEFLRVIDYKFLDEFLWNLYKPEHFGWCLGKSSPLYRGLYNNDNLNKAYESYSNEIKSASLYPGSLATLVADAAAPIPLVLRLSAGSYMRHDGDNHDYIKIDSKMCYEISFMVRVLDTTLTSAIEFGIDTFDADLNAITNANCSTGAPANDFVNFQAMRSDKYLFVRGYVYNSAKSVDGQDTLDINQGNNLIWNPDAKFIVPYIINDTLSNIHIYALRVLPLFTPYSRGLVQVKNWIDIWIKNRSNKSQQEIEDYTRRYLVPYNSLMKINQIGDFIYDQSIEATPTQTWIAYGVYCEVNASGLRTGNVVTGYLQSSLTGEVVLNNPSHPSYIAPVYNTSSCPLTVGTPDPLQVYLRYNNTSRSITVNCETGIGINPISPNPNYNIQSGVVMNPPISSVWRLLINMTSGNRTTYTSFLKIAKVTITALSAGALVNNTIKVYYNNNSLSLTGAVLLATYPIPAIGTQVDFSIPNFPLPSNYNTNTDYLIFDIS